MGNCCAPASNEHDLHVFQKTIALQKHGHYTATLIWGYRPAMLHCLRLAEKEKGRPVHVPEIAQVALRESYFPTPNPMLVAFAILDLWKNDEILGDKELRAFSSNPTCQSTNSNPTEYELYSDRHERLFSKYILDNRLRLRPKPETPVVNFK